MEEILEGFNKFIGITRSNFNIENTIHLVGFQHTGISNFGKKQTITSEIWLVDSANSKKKLIINYYSGEDPRVHNIEVYRLLFEYLDRNINSVVYNGEDIWK